MNKFINKLLLLVLSIGLVIGSSSAMQDSPSNENIALRYINFLANISPSSKNDPFPEIASLFSPNCHKVVNGKLISTNIIELEKQLRGAQVEFKEWTIELNQKNCIFFPEDNTYVLQFAIANIPGQKNSIVTKYITFDDNGLISNINEVYNIKNNHAFLAVLRESKPSAETDSAALKRAGERYIEFLQNFGKPGDLEDFDIFFKLGEIIAYKCLKSINGGIVSEGLICSKLLSTVRPGLISQLVNAKEAFGSWEISLEKDGLIADLQNNVCMVRYDITPSKSDATYCFIAYLRFDQAGNIEEINEVYNQKDS